MFQMSNMTNIFFNTVESSVLLVRLKIKLLVLYAFRLEHFFGQLNQPGTVVIRAVNLKLGGWALRTVGL